jgi:ABC-2 type transport system ATP-binding protein
MDAARTSLPTEREPEPDAVIERDPDAVIEARGLTKRYGKFTAVENLDLLVRRGEIFGFLGPNGAGKTTTILMLLGLTEPTAGSVRVCGFDPVRSPLAVKSVVGYLPDNVGFYPGMSARENLRYTASLNGLARKEADERIAALLEQVGLADAADKRAGTYSRGMRQRLAIADALIKRPSVLILDEPTIGIDPEGVRDLLAMLHTLSRDEGITILLSSHLLHQVQEVCDRVGIFVRGRLIASGQVRELEEQLALRDEWEFLVSVIRGDGQATKDDDVERAAASLRAIPDVREVSRHTDGLLVRAREDIRQAAVRALLEQGLLPVELHRRGLSLDDIYDSYFREEVSMRHVAD